VESWTTDISLRMLHFRRAFSQGIYPVSFHREAYGLFEDLSLLEELSIFLHLIKQLTLPHIYNFKSDRFTGNLIHLDCIWHVLAEMSFCALEEEQMHP
jgi:hypothetical protein